MLGESPYRLMSSKVDPESIKEELHKALATFVCMDHGTWPKPCRGCLDEVKNLVKPVRAALVRAAMAITSPNLDELPRELRRKPNDREYMAMGQAVELMFDMAKRGLAEKRPVVTVVVLKEPSPEPEVIK